jgi:hypothetical protein
VIGAKNNAQLGVRVKILLGDLMRGGFTAREEQLCWVRIGSNIIEAIVATNSEYAVGTILLDERQFEH